MAHPLSTRASLLRAMANLLFAALAATASAQEDAGRIEKRFEKPPEPKSSLQPLVFPINEQVPPEQAGALRFTLKELVIKGNTAFAAADLAPLYADLLGKEISLKDIYALRDALTAKYGNAGFGLSKAIVPEQRIQAQGLVSIEIIEGFVDEVIIEGGDGAQQEFLAYAAEKIKAERPLNARTLERYLLLANDRFAIKVTSTLKHSAKTPAASTLILKVEPAPKLEGGASLDNRGTEAVGPKQLNANLAVNGLGGRASQTALNYATTERSSELQYVALSHTEVLNPEGSTLTVGGNTSNSAPGTPTLLALDNRSVSRAWSLKLAHPFIRTRQENLSAYAKYDQKDTDSQSLGALVSQDKVRSLRFGLNYDRADAWEGVNQALLEASFGIRGFGATDFGSLLKSRADAKPDYQKLTATLSRTQELAYFSAALARFSVNASVMGQYSSTGLYSSEECGLGGTQFGRAFDASEILGDQCLAASLELRYSAATEGSPFKYAQFYGFYDAGFVRNVNPLSAADPLQKSLASAGFGLRFGIGPYVSASLEAAQPLGRDVANKGNRDARVFASLTAKF